MLFCGRLSIPFICKDKGKKRSRRLGVDKINGKAGEC